MRAQVLNHFACISISASINISAIPDMALFITIRMLYGNAKVKFVDADILYIYYVTGEERVDEA